MGYSRVLTNNPKMTTTHRATGLKVPAKHFNHDEIHKLQEAAKKKYHAMGLKAPADFKKKYHTGLKVPAHHTKKYHSGSKVPAKQFTHDDRRTIREELKKQYHIKVKTHQLKVLKKAVKKLVKKA